MEALSCSSSRLQLIVTPMLQEIDNAWIIVKLLPAQSVSPVCKSIPQNILGLAIGPFVKQKNIYSKINSESANTYLSTFVMTKVVSCTLVHLLHLLVFM